MERPTTQTGQDRTPCEQASYDDSPQGLLDLVNLVLVVTLLAERTGGAGLERFLERRLDLLHLVLAGELQTLLFRKIVTLTGLVDFLDLDHLAGRGVDRRDQL